MAGKCLHCATPTLRGAGAAAAAGAAVAAVARARRRPAREKKKKKKTAVRDEAAGWQDQDEMTRWESGTHTPGRVQPLLQALVVLDLRGDRDGHRPAPDGADEHGRLAASIGGKGRKRE